ncbi:MAG TPA: hypothetical protein VK357_15625, partial [Rubrobacteraceae bacterium]|nr:hypothetical protein [Rubrobacteraceae bacterium]
GLLEVSGGCKMPANTGIWSIDAFLNLSGYLLRLLHAAVRGLPAHPAYGLVCVGVSVILMSDFCVKRN